MISIQCEKCQAQFQIDETKLPAKNAKGRCGKCGHVFAIAQSSETLTSTQISQKINLDELFSSAAEEANSPSAPPTASFQVSQETMKKYQSKVNQSFKKSSVEVSVASATSEIALSKKDIQKHAAAFTTILLLIFLFSSMLRIGTLNPKYVWLSWKHGQVIHPQKVNFIDLRPGFYQSSTSKKYFHLSGKIYNATDQPLGQNLKMQIDLLSPSETLLVEIETPCCKEPVPSGGLVNFEVKSEISSEADVGSYKIKPLNP